MTYNEFFAVCEDIAADMGYSVIIDTPDHINEFRGNFPLMVIVPPAAKVDRADQNLQVSPFEYVCSIIFMDNIATDWSNTEKRNTVDAQQVAAFGFLLRLTTRTDLNPEADLSQLEGDPVIEPFFTFENNAFHTAGVVLTFTYQVPVDWNCLPTIVPQGTQSNPYEVTLAASSASFPANLGGISTVAATFPTGFADLFNSLSFNTDHGQASVEFDFASSGDDVTVSFFLDAVTGPTVVVRLLPVSNGLRTIWFRITLTITQA